MLSMSNFLYNVLCSTMAIVREMLALPFFFFLIIWWKLNFVHNLVERCVYYIKMPRLIFLSSLWHCNESWCSHDQACCPHIFNCSFLFCESQPIWLFHCVACGAGYFLNLFSFFFFFCKLNIGILQIIYQNYWKMKETCFGAMWAQQHLQQQKTG